MSLSGNGNGGLRSLADSVYFRLFSQAVNVIAGPLLIYLLIASRDVQVIVSHLQDQVDSIKSELQMRTVLRYTSEDAGRDFAADRFRLDTLEHRVQRLEDK